MENALTTPPTAKRRRQQQQPLSSEHQQPPAKQQRPPRQPRAAVPLVVPDLATFAPDLLRGMGPSAAVGATAPPAHEPALAPSGSGASVLRRSSPLACHQYSALPEPLDCGSAEEEDALDIDAFCDSILGDDFLPDDLAFLVGAGDP